MKRIVTVQDISCVGKCSLTVALPILSACGVETCVLPSAVLSTHTAGFSGFTFRDLTDDMPGILSHWQKENILFDAIYTGYLGSEKQIDYVLDIFQKASKEDTVTVVDPAMADNGKLYSIFDMKYVEAMKRLCQVADYILPNITEACFYIIYLLSINERITSNVMGVIKLDSFAQSISHVKIDVTLTVNSHSIICRKHIVHLHGSQNIIEHDINGTG